MPIRNCDKCKNFSVNGIKHECLKGHRPRFVMPALYYDNDWGWRYKCGDFVGKDSVDDRGNPVGDLHGGKREA